MQEIGMDSSETLTIYTVGHSNHSIEYFIKLLKDANITAIADVRSSPFSRYTPHFNRKELELSLKQEGIAYVFLGEQLGARTKDRSCYVNGQANYNLIAKTNLFREGVQRVLDGAKKYNIALMCAEKEPLDCHRTILVARHIENTPANILHIHANGTLETQGHAMSRLLKKLNIEEQDMFRSQQDSFFEAYEKQGERIAYTESVEDNSAELLVHAS